MMRRLESINNTTTGREARVYRDSEWQEWRVKHFEQGRHLAAADYHTDDKGDAQHHARAWAWHVPPGDEGAGVDNSTFSGVMQGDEGALSG